MDYIYVGKGHWSVELIDKLDFIPEVFGGYIDPSSLAIFIETAKQLPDNEDDFPKGKWAGIQHLQELLSDEIKKELHYQSVLPALDPRNGLLTA